MPTITITDEQKDRFQTTIDYVQGERDLNLEKGRVTQSDAFELLLELFESSLAAGMSYED